MNLSRLRLITFDVTNTLLKFRSAPGQQYGEIGAMYGVLCDRDSLSANFKAHWRKMNQEHPNFGLNSGLGWEKWWQMIVKGTFKDSRFNLDDKKLDAIASHLIDVYKTSACWQPCYGTQELLSFLRNRNVTMGIISNFDPRLGATLSNTKLRHFFEFILTSYEVGVEKPDPRIFHKAMEESKLKNLQPDECLHVGDTTALDYYGAKNSGWHGVLIDDRSAESIRKKYPDVDVSHVFPSLYDLHKYFVKTDNKDLSAQSIR
ncbi:rhythmically expressed gene 2 protein [Aethina tumida]|uniref:rhythmically expressed gene 2 protein n=1 Tax=Aethina tumida TaxID=116153 RepID=UPI002147CD7C|nr:rhythmically expressed gene 2 protein [Aethina tumida]